MFFVVVAVVLIALKLADIGPVAAWSWWLVLSPLALAAAWWAFADASGMTKRREMDKLDDRKAERRRKAMAALGMDAKHQGRETAAARARRLSSERAEGSRTQARQKNEKTVRDSVFDSQQSTGFGEADKR